MSGQVKAPPGLSAAGKRLWSSVSSDLVLDAREIALLEMACRQVDDIARLEAEVAVGGVTVEGSMGQVRVNGALAELRQARLAVARLLGQIDLPEAGEAQAPTEASRRARQAAQKRWASDARRAARGA
jgi:hypothetical protein